MKYAIVAAALASTVLASPAWGPPGQYGDDSWGTSTVEVTTEVTITSCAATVTDCPAGSPTPSGYPVTTPVESSPVTSSAPAVYPSGSAPAGYPSPSGSWGAPAPSGPAGSAPPAYPSSPVESSPVESSPPVYSSPASAPPAPYPSAPAGSAPPAPYPQPSGTGVAVGPTGTAGGAYPTGSSWIPATGAASSVQTGGILAAAGALFALFL